MISQSVYTFHNIVKSSILVQYYFQKLISKTNLCGNVKKFNEALNIFYFSNCVEKKVYIVTDTDKKNFNISNDLWTVFTKKKKTK